MADVTLIASGGSHLIEDAATRLRLAMRPIEQRIEDDAFDAAVSAIKEFDDACGMLASMIRDAQDARRRARFEEGA